MSANGGKKLGVAVVGAGNMGRHHARNYAELPDAELRAVVDVDRERALQIASRYGCRAFGSVEEMLAEEPGIAAVSVAVPTTGHYEVARDVLEAGRHVLVEKPIVPTVEEATELIDLADERRLTLAVGHVERFNPAVRELKRRIDAGAMGKVLSLVARRVGVMPPQVTDTNVILDLGIHDIDIFRYLLGADAPCETFCNAGTGANDGHVDFADIFFRFGEVGCMLQVNWLTPVKIRSLAATGSHGYAELRYVTQELDFYEAQPIREAESFSDVAAYSEQEPERIEFEHGEPLERELREFLKAVRGEGGEIVDGRDARTSLEVATEVVGLVGSR